MREETQRAPSPSLIALGRTFASADEAVKAVQQFARSVQQRRVRVQQVSAAGATSGSEGSKVPSSSNSRSSSNNKGRRHSIQRRPFSTAESDATLLATPAPSSPPVRNQAHVLTPSTTSSIQLGCENGPSGCKWAVGLERAGSGGNASSSPPHWQVSFSDLNHGLQCCRGSGSAGTSSSSRNSMDDDAELRLHQLFAPAPVSDTTTTANSSSHGAGLQAPANGTSEAFFQHQQVGEVVGAAHRYFPSSSSGPVAAAAPVPAPVGPDSSTPLDNFELEKYAINHVANSFAPLPVELPSMIFDISGFAAPHHTHHQLWDESGFQYHHQQQQYQHQYHHHHHQQQQQHLGSGHSTPLGAEPSRVYAVHGHVVTNSNHRDVTEPATASPVSSQPRPVALSALSPGATHSLLAKKQSVALNTKMRWISAKEASKAVNDYALFVQKKRARMDKKTSGGRNKKYICSCTDCGWFVRLIKVTKSDNWKISSMQLAHSGNCTGEAQPSARQLAELNTMRNRVITASSGSGKLEITHDDAEYCNGTGRGGALGGREGERLLVQTDFTAEGESLGVKIPVRLAYRAKKILQENSTNSSFSINAIVKGVMGLPGHDLQEKIAESYKLLPSLLQKFSDLNPGSAVCLKKDEKGRFKSAFVLPTALSDLVPSLQGVFGLEIVPCGNSSASSPGTSPRYNGYFIVFLGKDGNLEHRVIAFGLIPTPDTENVAWFLRSLHNAGFQMGENVPVFLAYHQLGALAALRREFPLVLSMFCVESFIRAIEQQLLGVSQANLDFVKHQVRLASLAETVEAFHAQLSIVAQHFPSVTNFLLSFDASLWTLYASRSVKKYQWISTGFREYLSAEVEIIIKTKRPIERGASRPLRSQQQQRQLLYTDESGGYDVQRIKSIQLADFDTMVPLEIIYQFLLHYLHIETRRAVDLTSALASPQVRTTTIMTMNVQSQSQSLVQLTPGAEKLFHQELFESQHVKVCASEDPAIALVLSKYATEGVGHRVHMVDRRCSCATMYQMGIPCRHLIAAARAFKGEKVILTDCDKVYTMAVYQLSLQRQSSLEDRMPALGGLNRDSSIYPAPIYGSFNAMEGHVVAAQAQARGRSSSSSSKRRAREEDAGEAYEDGNAVAVAGAKRTHLPIMLSDARGGFSTENDAAAGNAGASTSYSRGSSSSGGSIRIGVGVASSSNSHQQLQQLASPTDLAASLKDFIVRAGR